jgi:tRNA pseudouridine38-40 synthase
MPRFKLHLEYQGTVYKGWQIQRDAKTVAGELTRVIHGVAGATPFELYGAGRTDAGVHALEQVAHLDLETRLAPEILRRQLNEALPSDIYVLRIERVADRFHARHSAVARSYLYQIARRKSAFGKKLVWWVRDELDVERMRRAAELFVGMKSYVSFAAGDPDEVSSRVLIDKIEIGEAGDLILIRIEGSHFLWKMVRRIVGVLAEVGKGKLGLNQVAFFLRERSDVPARLAAPGSGLFLEKVYYEEDARLDRLEPVLRVDVGRPVGRA